RGPPAPTRGRSASAEGRTLRPSSSRSSVVSRRDDREKGPMGHRAAPATLGAMTSELDLDQPTSEGEQALIRLKKRRDLQGLLVAYLAVNAALWVIWAMTGAGYAWPAWVSGAWAIGIVLNAWDVYFRAPITEADVQREM